MNQQQACACGAAPTLVFPCSGASDVGAISDQAARQLTRAGIGKMYCLAGIGGRVSDIVMNTQAAGRILAIDGCPHDCASKCLQQGGFTGFLSVRVTDLGFEKGKSPVAPECIGVVATRVTELLLASTAEVAAR